MERLDFGPVRVYLGDKSGKYPDGNQVIVQGSDTRVAFDTPRVALHIGPDLDEADMVLLGHVHEDHTVALGRLRHAAVQVHQADLAAVQSWDGMARHYGYTSAALEALRPMIERDFSYQPRPDASGYTHGSQWDLGGGVRVRAHHLPGHTAGHSALVVDSEGIAFIGDIDLTGFGPYYGDATSDLRQFQRSLRDVGELDARTGRFTPAHALVMAFPATAFQRTVPLEGRELTRFFSGVQGFAPSKYRKILEVM